MENKAVDPRLNKYSDANSIYYHCSTLKKLLDENDRKLFQPLETSLQEQELMKPPYGSCYSCGSAEHRTASCTENKTTTTKPPYGNCYKCGSPDHWTGSCTEKKTTAKKPHYGHCYRCGSTDHWLPACPHKDSEQSDETKPSTSEQPTSKTKKKRRHTDDTKVPSKKKSRPTSPTAARHDKKKCCVVCKEDTHMMKNCPKIVKRKLESEN